MEIHVSDSSTDICDTSLEIEFHRFNFSEAVYNELRVFISCKELFQQGELSYPEILLLYEYTPRYCSGAKGTSFENDEPFL